MGSDWLGAILGAGGVAFIGAMFKGFQMVRDGARAREREAIAGLEKWRDDADDRATKALAEADYQRRLVAWNQARVGMRDYVILANGLPTPDDPPPPVPPGETPPPGRRSVVGSRTEGPRQVRRREAEAPDERAYDGA